MIDEASGTLTDLEAERVKLQHELDKEYDIHEVEIFFRGVKKTK